MDDGGDLYTGALSVVIVEVSSPLKIITKGGWNALIRFRGEKRRRIRLSSDRWDIPSRLSREYLWS